MLYLFVALKSEREPKRSIRKNTAANAVDNKPYGRGGAIGRRATDKGATLAHDVCNAAGLVVVLR